MALEWWIFTLRPSDRLAVVVDHQGAVVKDLMLEGVARLAVGRAEAARGPKQRCVTLSEGPGQAHPAQGALGLAAPGEA